jgi:hypothetical protein
MGTQPKSKELSCWHESGWPPDSWVEHGHGYAFGGDGLIPRNVWANTYGNGTADIEIIRHDVAAIMVGANAQ